MNTLTEHVKHNWLHYTLQYGAPILAGALIAHAASSGKSGLVSTNNVNNRSYQNWQKLQYVPQYPVLSPPVIVVKGAR